MKFRLFALVLLFIAAIHPASAQTAPPKPDLIKVAIGDWPPYFGKNLPGYGIASQLITEAFAVSGIKVEYVFFPWNRSLEQARNGWIEATGGWSDVDNRRADFHFSKILITSNFVLYYPKAKPLICQSIKDLYGHKIGATLGYYYGDEFEQAAKDKKIQVIRAATDQINLQNLALGRLDGFVLDEIVANYMLANDLPAANAEKISTSAFSVNTDPLHLLVSRKVNNGEEIIRLFDYGLETIRKNGSYDRIVKAPVIMQAK